MWKNELTSNRTSTMYSLPISPHKMYQINFLTWSISLTSAFFENVMKHGIPQNVRVICVIVKIKR